MQTANDRARGPRWSIPPAKVRKVFSSPLNGSGSSMEGGFGRLDQLEQRAEAMPITIVRRCR